MGGEPEAEIKELRARASRMGLTIRTQRSNGTSKRAYSLVDRESGTVLHRNIDGLIAVEAVLSRIVWDGQLARADGPPTNAGTPICSTCGTPRVGQFRWCRTCGQDFEPTAHVAARWPPFQLPEPEPSTEPIQPTEAVRPTSLASIPIPRPEYGPGPRHRRWLHVPFRDRDSVLTLREVVIGAALGLLIGGVTALLLSAR